MNNATFLRNRPCDVDATIATDNIKEPRSKTRPTSKSRPGLFLTPVS